MSGTSGNGKTTKRGAMNRASGKEPRLASSRPLSERRGSVEAKAARAARKTLKSATRNNPKR